MSSEEKKQTTVGVVVPQTTTLDLPEGGFSLEDGGTLARIDVAWESCGLERPENDNVVFICHALTGDAHVAGRYPDETESSGWWDGIVGPGKAIDTNRYRVICANVLGGCKGTTGPSSVDPATGRPYGSAFPRFTLGDTVEVYRLLLRQLGVTHLAALVGGSFGGVQVIEWITAHPDEVDRAVMIAAGVALNAQALAFDIVGRAAITFDPNWNGGDYYGAKGPLVGLASARQMAHITYLSLDLLNRRFGRKLQDNWIRQGKDFIDRRAEWFGTTFAIESYLEYQAKKFLARFDANSYLHITRALDLYDATVKYGSMDEVCRRIRAKLLLVSISGDWLFSAEQSRVIATGLLKAGKAVSYSHLDIKVGHDGFLTHTKELGRIMSGFFRDPVTPELTPEKTRKFAPIAAMVPEGARVLDIGCGTGALMALLRREKRADGTGVEIDFDKICTCVAAGESVLFEDADEGLTLLPDRAWRFAILSETLQTVKKPRELLAKILEKADEAVVTFPNFAAWSIRLHLLLTGRMPVERELPFEWYDTPNTHFFTLADFRALCEKDGIEVREVVAESNNLLGRLLIACGLPNLGASRIVVRIARSRKTAERES